VVLSRTPRESLLHTGDQQIDDHSPQVQNADVMSRYAQLSALTFTVILSGVLFGCAVYRKCGFEGCPGDAAIPAEIETLFSQHPALEPPNLLNVNTLDHVVYFNGLVDTDLFRTPDGGIGCPPSPRCSKGGELHRHKRELLTLLPNLPNRDFTKRAKYRHGR